jgi:hypothetical protein
LRLLRGFRVFSVDEFLERLLRAIGRFFDIQAHDRRRDRLADEIPRFPDVDDLRTVDADPDFGRLVDDFDQIRRIILGRFRIVPDGLSCARVAGRLGPQDDFLARRPLDEFRGRFLLLGELADGQRAGSDVIRLRRPGTSRSRLGR